MDTIRFGILGAAQIAPKALVAPARTNDDVVLEAVAARDLDRAREFAERHGVNRALASYDEVLADPAIDAVYIGLPNNLHAPWTAKALQAGKHVLVEKPFASNADEAAAVADAAAGSDKVVMEAFHNRYHPLTEHVRGVLAEGRLGDLTHASATFDIHLEDRGDIRYNYELAGGSLMDLGCYSVHFLRSVLGTEPTVVSATARTADHELVDEAISAELTFPDDIRATVACSLLDEPQQLVTLTGTRGELRVEGFVLPQEGNRVVLVADGEEATSEYSPETTPTSYESQLAAFVTAVREGTPVLTDPADSVATMKVIDAIYEAAGLGPRRATRA